MRPCTGKTALVTSASDGVGRAVALALGKAGAQVLIHHARSPGAAEAVVESIRMAGGRAKAVAVDLASSAGPHELAQRARAIIGDRLDILVFNAKFSKAIQQEDEPPAIFDAEFAANVRAPLFLVQQLMPVMNRGSSLVFTLPSAAPSGAAPTPAASTIHSGLQGLAHHFATFLNPRGIRVDLIVPGFAKNDNPGTGLEATPFTGAEQPAEIAKAVVAAVSRKDEHPAKTAASARA